MLTTTATFDKYNMRANTPNSYIVKITGGSTTFYFSDRIINLSASSIITEAVVVNFGSLNQKIDLFKKTCNISNVKLKLINTPYIISSGSLACLSDILAADNIFNVAVEIYYWIEGITNITDCLKLFDGLAQPIKKANPETLELDILDNSVYYHRSVPKDYVDLTTFPNAPDESIGKPLPLVYGNFDMDTENVGVMSEGIWIEPNKVAFAGHILKSISSVWLFDENLDALVKLDPADYTITLDDSGIATVAISDMNALNAHFYHLPFKEDITQDNDYTTYPFFNMERIRDKELDTEGQIKHPTWDYEIGGAGTHTITGNSKWYLATVAEDAGTIIAAWMEVYFHTYNTSHLSALPTLDYSDASIELSFANDDQWKTVSLMGIPGGFDWNDWDGGFINLDVEYLIVDGYTELLSYGMQEIRLHIKYTCGIKTGWRIFAECQGRKFGSWIDEGGRSNSYNEGDLIENPAHMIESILRDELGLTASDVDVTSFDTVGGDLTSWNMAMSIISLIRSDLLIAKIGHQSKTHAFFDSQGTAKIGILDASGISFNDNFYKDDIKLRKIFLSQGEMKQLINSVDLLYMPETLGMGSGFQKYASGTNSTSISDYNITKHKSLAADYIHSDTVATNFLNHFISATGYWKDLQEIMEITMRTFEFIYWEIGDVIRPNRDIDDVIKLFNDDFGTSGYAPLFLITEKRIGKDLRFRMQRMGQTGPPA